MKQIHEVLRRSYQGITGPFICRDEDGRTCFVKGRGTGYRGLCCEWMGGRIAQALQLPIPEFALVEIPALVIQLSSRPDINDLGAGVAFASYEITGVNEPTWPEINKAQWDWYGAGLGNICERILLFDWWTCNPDRIFGRQGGNPNMLWSTTGPQLWVIDHNLCFSPEHNNMSSFWEDHAFRVLGGTWDARWIASAKTQLTSARALVPDFWAELPEEWTDSTSLSLQEIDEILAGMDQPGFWLSD